SKALSLAFKKTVILELDMRKPKIAEYFGLNASHKGLSEYLNGNANIDDIIQKVDENNNLSLISCGSLIDNPSELLEKKELSQLIEKLKEDFDDIIIDSPPAHLVPDAIILSRLSDLTLYIVRQGYTDKKELHFLKQLQDQSQIPNIGIVFNSLQRVKYGYGYQYDDSYYSNTKSSFFKPLFGDFKSRF
ncbi:MAG: polysaccharide biosynthesis tyrosine autokinase, partial [Pedobacter sp.]